MRFDLTKKALSLAVVGASVIGVSAMTTGSASAATYTCKTSDKSIDDWSYGGPLPDNFDVKIKNCIRRSGSYVYGYSTMNFDFAPEYAGTDFRDKLDGAEFRFNINHVDGGPDTVFLKKDYDLMDDFARLNGSGNVGAKTRVWKKKVGSKSAYVDGTVRLNWNRDGKGFINHGFAGTRSV
ncbi:hypothetical protein [Streptomyces mesophilus]|uniref:hypothetical protein n=1 Tax=Streptomyces mesophilus TaxID=1775132 RepID=UPI003328DB86